ncbi:MAG: hypothetical protein ACREIA_06355 [Opitutaceae bacterium]
MAIGVRMERRGESLVSEAGECESTDGRAGERGIVLTIVSSGTESAGVRDGDGRARGTGSATVRVAGRERGWLDERNK